MKTLKKAVIVVGTAVLGLSNYTVQAQVGIGTTLPQEKLHVHDGSVLVTTPQLPAENDPFYDPASPIPMQYGFRWHNSKSALRSIGERVGTGALDPQNFGEFSFASGYEAFASGNSALSFGQRTTAAGVASFAGGLDTWTSGNYSFAFGISSSANAHGSVAIGNQVSTNAKTGSFIFGDNSNSSAKNDATNQMVMRFSGGYQLFSNANSSAGVFLTPNSNSWSSISDINKKENFAPVNGDDFLNKIASMKLTSWNYKGQDPKAYRHYGPMAQDFYKAFGRDEFGTIGTDTTINQADFDGVNLIAIQALVRRMDKMNSDLRQEIASLKAQMVMQGEPSKRKRILVSKK